MWLFNIVPRTERLYWIIMPLFFIGIITLISYIFRPTPNKPVLKAQVDGINIHPNPNDPNSTSMLLIISVRNSGMPTILENWSITTKLDSGRTILAENQFIPETLDLEGPGGKMTYRREDAIYIKTVNAPIVQGGMVRGIIWVTFRGIEVNTFKRPGTKIEVNFNDVIGSKHIIFTSISGISSAVKYFSGLSIPFKSEKTK